MWPRSGPQAQSAPLPPRSGGEGSGVGGLSADSLAAERAETPPTPDLESELCSPRTPPRAMRVDGGGRTARGHNNRPHTGHNNPHPPTLTEVVTTLRTLGKTELPKQLSRWLDELDETGRWA